MELSDSRNIPRAIVYGFLTGLMTLVLVVGAPNVASAQFCNNQNTASEQDDACANEGDADAEADQDGDSSSGDGVAGQVAGVVSSGDASVDATNRSNDVDVETGSATGRNRADVVAEAAVFNNAGASACNNQLAAGAEQDNACHNAGDADTAINQAADAASGDGVGGQVIGAVVSGSADIVLANESTDADVTTGDAEFENDAGGFSGAGVFLGIGPFGPGAPGVPVAPGEPAPGDGVLAFCHHPPGQPADDHAQDQLFTGQNAIVHASQQGGHAGDHPPVGGSCDIN